MAHIHTYRNGECVREGWGGWGERERGEEGASEVGRREGECVRVERDV